MKRIILAASLLSLILLICSCSQDGPAVTPTMVKINITTNADGFSNSQLYYGLGISRIQYKISNSTVWKDVQLSNQGFSIDSALNQSIDIEMRALDRYSDTIYTGRVSVDVGSSDVSIDLTMTDTGIKEYFGVFLFDIDTSFENLIVTVEGDNGFYEGSFKAESRRIYNNPSIGNQIIALPRGNYSVTFRSGALEYKSDVVIRAGYETYISGELTSDMDYTTSPMSCIYFKIIQDGDAYSAKIYNNALTNISYSWYIMGVKVGESSVYRTSDILGLNTLGCNIFAYRGDSPLVGTAIF